MCVPCAIMAGAGEAMFQHGAGAEPEWCGRARGLSCVSDTEVEVAEEGSQ